MAKVSLTKLGLKTNQDIKTITFNEQDIEVKQYLPINEKLIVISNVINNSADDYSFSNPVKIKAFTELEIIYNYTNINFTDKQKEDGAKLYDLLFSSGLMEEIFNAIPYTERENIIDGVQDSIRAIYSYKNSIMGILDNISTDYSNLNLDATEIQKKIGNPENITLLKDVLAKLG